MTYAMNKQSQMRNGLNSHRTGEIRQPTIETLDGSSSPRTSNATYDQSGPQVPASDCPICLEPIAKDQRSVLLPCAHTFDRDCITAWLQNSNLCPTCRQVATEQMTDIKSETEFTATRVVRRRYNPDNVRLHRGGRRRGARRGRRSGGQSTQQVATSEIQQEVIPQPAIVTANEERAPSGMPQPESEASVQNRPQASATSHCLVCQGPMVAEQRAVLLPCAHTFGRDCITAWLQYSNTCPRCRQAATELRTNIVSETQFTAMRLSRRANTYNILLENGGRRRRTTRRRGRHGRTQRRSGARRRCVGRRRGRRFDDIRNRKRTYAH